MKKACFFVKVNDKELLKLVQWYKNDIQILKDLGYKVKIATTFSEIPLNMDLYFSWWATSSILPLIKAKISKRPIIVVAGGSEVVHLEGEPTSAGYINKPFILRQIIKFNLKHSTVVISVSKSIQKEVDDLGTKRNIVIYHGIDTEIYKPYCSSKRNIIFTLSHITESHIIRKRIFTIIDAAKLIIKDYPNIKFVIAGAKSDAISKVKQRIADNQIEKNIFLPGKVSEKEKISYFSKSLIYLQPTIHEGFGVAIAEAMSCGVPVVTSKVAATPEVVGDCGIYADPNRPEDVADKIKLLLSNEELRSNLSYKSRERIESKFSYELRKQKIKKLIQLID